MSHQVIDSNTVASTVATVARLSLGDGEYLLGNSREEIQRLIYQGSFFKPFTRRLFVEAGLEPGMRVLDLGSGAGDVALLAAELVGRDGEVVGIDRDPAVLAVARSRAEAEGRSNVSFAVGDLLDAEVTGTFDALVGRFILMYQPDPAATIRSLVRRFRPGAIVVFHEADFDDPIMVPAGPLVRTTFGWWNETLARRGIEPHMGLKLFSTFLAAGLPSPDMAAEVLMSGGEDSPVPLILQELTRSILPVMEQLGIARREDVDVETLADRIRAETIAGGGSISSPLMVGAWTRTR